MIGTVPICRASLEDIRKALRGKSSVTVEQARDRLPNEVKDFAHLFTDKKGATDLMESRRSFDHAINLKQDNGKTQMTTWGPLYNMS